MSPILDHTRIAGGRADPARWLYLLHGIFGSGRNWATLARRLVEERPDWGAILVDLRLHGGSVGFDPPHTVTACAEDLAALEATLGLPPTAILGHSFGGKVALVRAAAQPAGIEQVWVADSTLDPGKPAGTAWRVVEIVRELPADFASRDELVDAMAGHGYERGVGQWLAMNLERDGERYRWKLDWAGVEELLRDYYATDVWPILEEPPEATEIHVVRAIASAALDPSSLRRIRDAGARTGRVHLHEVAGGHWINVENPDAVMRLLTEKLPS